MHIVLKPSWILIIPTASISQENTPPIYVEGRCSLTFYTNCTVGEWIHRHRVNESVEVWKFFLCLISKLEVGMGSQQVSNLPNDLIG